MKKKLRFLCNLKWIVFLYIPFITVIILVAPISPTQRMISVCQMFGAMLFESYVAEVSRQDDNKGR